ncbi:MAG: EMC3/TMCO1 family protein [Candidatus Thermoplasmatota archaeon]|jgi:uncharacterized membrane protein (DUF106 family)|nr:EMC3/TMCO1 family protein [Candidatus Thermoplasmatota archaeon]
MRKIDNKAQGSTLILLLVFILLIFFIMPTLAPYLANYLGYILYPLIGFDGNYPVLTLFFAGFIVVFFSSLLTNFFTNWKKLGEAQEISKAFQQEMMKARKEGNINKVNKLMKMQPEIMRKQTDASGGTMKPMIFLIIFIWPIFIWLRVFLQTVPHYYFTVPWANQVSFFSYPLLWQAWLWLYLIFSTVIGQVIRQGLKYASLSETWRKIKSRIRPSSV